MNPMRLIDADALVKEAEMRGHHLRPMVTTFHMCVDVQTIKKAPTIEAAPIRHGRWIKTEEPLGWADVLCGECSNCHESYIVDEDSSFDDFAMWSYCPNCGAKMDGERSKEK